MKNKLSIITINYNNHVGLAKTINSVVSQTFHDFEFIIIDGGSTDGSVKEIKLHESKITYWQSQKDNGIYDAQNIGITKSKGEYCLFLNSGDYLCDTNVLQQVFENNPTEDILYGDIIYLENGTTKRRKIFPDKLTNYFLITDVIGHQVQFIKRNLFEKSGAYNTAYKIVADYEFFIRLYFKHKIQTKHLPFFISVYDLSGLSANANQIKIINEERHKIQRIYFPKLLVMLYHSYATIVKSHLYNLPLVAKPVNLIRNLIFKFIKPSIKS